MIKFFLILFVTTGCFCYSQKKVPTYFIVKGDTITNVDYYWLTDKTKIELAKVSNNIVLTDEMLKSDEVKIRCVAGKKRLDFYIKPKSMYYLNISKAKGLFSKKYIINQGFDYEEIVKCSRR
ncbi:hypothetical protein SAMN04487891_1199 [Flagellimonas taeanensis]|uniref:Uncharacterized protein n=1 Tax=Flagellimonas taeanensis TaxID=1005926 RepID=A0A1M7CWI8_9FLAO|nr:hypothetical protein [Allomuricauda taeanensis]SFC66409.1 hypothetical protein SAMN04487891_1199 [Allomuricauda taeanensis]SHL71493.1 hypothetical protein SAMN05216293_4130 [Allomuricauda taeanensis]